MSSSTPIQVSIYGLPHSNKGKEHLVEYNFYATEKLTWSNLVQFIQERKINTETSPTTLYYKIDQEIRSLNNQEQLERLLTIDNIQSLRFYGQKKLMKQPVFQLSSSPPPLAKPISAFSRLGKLTDKHKKIISSSRELSRCVGILASAIAMDTQDKDFGKEFNALEKVIKARKNDFDSVSAASREENDERTLVDEPLDNPFAEFGHPGRGRGRRGGFGIGFGGRGDFFGGNHRGREHHYGDIFSDHSHHYRGEQHNSRGDFGHHHHPRGALRHHHHRGDFGHHHTRGDFEGGHYHHHHHHHGGPADFFAAILASEEKLDVEEKKQREVQACFRGKASGVLSTGREDEMPADNELSGLETSLFSMRIDGSKQKRHGKGSKKKRAAKGNNEPIIEG